MNIPIRKNSGAKLLPYLGSSQSSSPPSFFGQGGKSNNNSPSSSSVASSIDFPLTDIPEFIGLTFWFQVFQFF
jgi:hypothetical protein